MAVSAQYSVTIRVELDARQEPLGKLTAAIAEAGGQLQGVDLVPGRRRRGQAGARVHDRRPGPRALGADPARRSARPAAPGCSTTSTARCRCTAAARSTVENKYPLKTRDDLSMAYTPGVARVCQDIHADRTKAFEYTIKKNTVAVVSDGSAVLGLGNIGPEAAMPVMEGKAMLFKEFAERRRLPDLPRHPGRRRDHQGGRTDRADLRRHQPRGHLRPALLRDRGPAEGVARHPRLPRRPARHRGGDDGGALQRAEDRRQADRGAAGAGGWPRRRRGSGDEDDARLRRHPHRRLRPPGRALDRAATTTSRAR